MSILVVTLVYVYIYIPSLFFLSFLQNTAIAYILIWHESVRLCVLYVYLFNCCFFIYSLMPFSSRALLNLQYLTNISIWFSQANMLCLPSAIPRALVPDFKVSIPTILPPIGLPWFLWDHYRHPWASIRFCNLICGLVYLFLN